MRTTIDLEEDVLMVAKEIARERRSTVGKVISQLARKALTEDSPKAESDDFLLFPESPNPRVVTLELVNRLRDEAP